MNHASLIRLVILELSLGCLVTYPDNAERVRRIVEQAFGSVGIRPTIKVTVFDLNVLEAR